MSSAPEAAWRLRNMAARSHRGLHACCTFHILAGAHEIQQLLHTDWKEEGRTRVELISLSIHWNRVWISVKPWQNDLLEVLSYNITTTTNCNVMNRFWWGRETKGDLSSDLQTFGLCKMCCHPKGCCPQCLGIPLTAMFKTPSEASAMFKTPWEASNKSLLTWHPSICNYTKWYSEKNINPPPLIRDLHLHSSSPPLGSCVCSVWSVPQRESWTGGIVILGGGGSHAVADVRHSAWRCKTQCERHVTRLP